MAYEGSQEKVNWRTSVCTKSEKQLDIGEVMKLLENIDQYPNVSYPPAKPKAGDAYLFVAAIREEQGRSWFFALIWIYFPDLKILIFFPSTRTCAK